MSTENQSQAPMVANPEQLRIRELEEALVVIKTALESGQKRGRLNFIPSLVGYINALIAK